MEQRLDLSHGPSATEAAGQAVPTRAHVVHAAAAVYLGIGSRELRGVLGVGVSLADVAEWQGRGVEGLKRALLNALGRTGDDHATGLTGLVDQIVPDRLAGEAGAAAGRRCGVSGGPSRGRRCGPDG